MSSSSPQPHLSLPPRPSCRRPSPRSATLCFWTILLLFLAGLGYIGLLAFTGDNGLVPSTSVLDGHLLAGSLLAGCTIAAVTAGCATRNHHR